MAVSSQTVAAMPYKYRLMHDINILRYNGMPATALALDMLVDLLDFDRKGQQSTFIALHYSSVMKGVSSGMFFDRLDSSFITEKEARRESAVRIAEAVRAACDDEGTLRSEQTIKDGLGKIADSLLSLEGENDIYTVSNSVLRRHYTIRREDLEAPLSA